jgi:Ca2+-binding EF-hand superfamily protein
VVNPHIRITPD